MNCTKTQTLVKLRNRKLVFKVYYYNNNLTHCQSVTFTNWRRAASFIQILELEDSIPMVYLETIEVQ